MICVDGSRPDLEMTVDMSRRLPYSAYVYGFSKASDALLWLEGNRADIAIIEAELPDMNGVALAARLLEDESGISVIFLAASSSYALDAYKLHPSGYILKPLTEERLAYEVEYALAQKKPQSKGAPTANNAVIARARTFGEFVLAVGDRPVSFQRSKSKETLAYLIDKRGCGATRAELFGVICGNTDYNRAGQKIIDTIIRSMRHTLNEYGIGDIVKMEKGTLRIRPERLDCDMFRLLDGDKDAAKAFNGEYMNSYSWARQTESYLMSAAANI